MLSGISETFAFSTPITDKVESKRTPGSIEIIRQLFAEFILIIVVASVVAIVVSCAVVIILLAGLYVYSPTACYIVAGALAAGMIFSCAKDQCKRD